MKKRPQFFAMYKDFNTGKVESYDVLKILFSEFLTDENEIKKEDFTIFDNDWKRIPVRTKEQLQVFIEHTFRYYFWAKCEWEFIVIDWPNRDTIDESRPVKIDVFSQLKPNIPVITDIVWNFIKSQIKKLDE